MVTELAAEKITIRAATGSRFMLTTNGDIFLRKSLISPLLPRAKRISNGGITGRNIEATDVEPNRICLTMSNGKNIIRLAYISQLRKILIRKDISLKFCTFVTLQCS